MLNPPSKDELRRWGVFIDSIVGDFSSETIDKLRQIWSDLIKHISNAPLPLVTNGEEDFSLVLTWETDECLLDIEILPNGLFFWFFRNRKTNYVDGTDDPIENIPKQFIELFQQNFIEQ